MPMLMIVSPDAARQVTQGQTLHKAPGQHKFLKPLTGGYDLDTMEGEEWKLWHNVFSPGFRISNIMALVPSLSEMAAAFCGRLRQCARNSHEAVSLSPLALDLTMDFSAKAIMDHDLHCQTGYNDFASAMMSQLSWLHYSGTSPLKDLNFIRPLVQCYNTWRMDKYINRVLAENSRASRTKQTKPISVLGTANIPQEMNHTRVLPKVIRSQIKFMMLAGYDTTGSSIVFMINLLSQHPEVLARVRAEHDEIFGPDLSATRNLIASQPKLLNQLPYTTAVIKESLRLYPPGLTSRLGRRSFQVLIDATPEHGCDYSGPGINLSLPTDGCHVIVNHYAIHRNPRYWVYPDEFIPERWLEKDRDDLLQPPANGWRPFERGPRSCIGQEMALTEIKLVCALTAREFDFNPAYDECGRMERYHEDPVYLVSRGGAANPSGYYPCRVSFAKR
ncbi:putative sterigmatocystin biosynthesis P450 monooxygenase stcS-like protein 4 [Colletotrichum chlorophyti]|uniref:Putative sterigmatocystin biosynthesis P450 monooxygenase stcS-like protein 4 n=1 Tax=Colletotrichum chlorophyti TaxID=708187 RepID=A0A1Q8RLH3_9PEZI|nr:putative sterigmatocystin biosynthesis P450 monooxygenase stcS-like protein 4 [Colletotrichum chlorophyti]